MAEPGMTVEEADDHLAVTVDAVEIARYVFRPRMPVIESSKPYLYPLRSLTGAPMAGYRPWDHRWHRGIQLTLSHLSGQNFWGGPTFDPTVTDPPHGYVQRDNNGRQRHDAFEEARSTADEIDGGGTVLVFAGRSSAPVPIKWFVRTGEFAGICPSPAFDSEFGLAPGERGELWHRVVFADHRCDQNSVVHLADRYRP